MFDLLFDGHHAWFGIPAIIGTLFFVVRMILMFAGGDAGDFDVDADVGAAGHADHSGDAMKALSIQSILTFAMGFGWGGLAALHGFEQSWGISMVVGVAVGAAMVWMLGLLLKAVHDLTSSGNVDIGSALGSEGSIYVRVPERGEGRGQVRLVVNGRQRIYNAVTEGEALQRNVRVRVTRVNEDNTLTVARA